MEGQQAVRVRIAGQVQGVGFRAWVQAEARRLGLVGWVRNERDGSVSALLVGSRDGVTAMLQRLHAGPPAARVSDVRVEDAVIDERPAGFLVTR